MIDKAIIANPRTRYGSGKHATRHFITQRVTGALNVLFTGFLIWFVLRLAGSARADMVSVVAHPVVAIVLILLIVNVMVHMRIGMREVIEDYVDEGRTNRFSLMLNTMAALAIGLVGVVSVIKIWFWG